MNKFIVMPCVKNESETSYSGVVLPIRSTIEPNVAMFFPISEEYASLINYVLSNQDSDEPLKKNHILSIYETMIETWDNGDRYLGGILIDVKYDKDYEDDIIGAKLIICNQDDGAVDSVTDISFPSSILLASMLKKEVILTSQLLKKLSPDFENEDTENEDKDDNDDKPKKTNPKNKEDKKAYPNDEKILQIAKDIMQRDVKK